MAEDIEYVKGERLEVFGRNEKCAPWCFWIIENAECTFVLHSDNLYMYMIWILKLSSLKMITFEKYLALYLMY